MPSNTADPVLAVALGFADVTIPNRAAPEIGGAGSAAMPNEP
jgi:hypothetical protein